MEAGPTAGFPHPPEDCEFPGRPNVQSNMPPADQNALLTAEDFRSMLNTAPTPATTSPGQQTTEHSRGDPHAAAPLETLLAINQQYSMLAKQQIQGREKMLAHNATQAHLVGNSAAQGEDTSQGDAQLHSGDRLLNWQDAAKGDVAVEPPRETAAQGQGGSNSFQVNSNDSASHSSQLGEMDSMSDGVSDMVVDTTPPTRAAELLATNPTSEASGNHRSTIAGQAEGVSFPSQHSAVRSQIGTSTSGGGASIPGTWIPLGVSPGQDAPAPSRALDSAAAAATTTATHPQPGVPSTAPEQQVGASDAAGTSAPFDPDKCQDMLTVRLGKCLTSGTDVSISRVDVVPEMLAILKDCHTEAHRAVLHTVLVATVEQKRTDVLTKLLDSQLLTILKKWLVPGPAGSASEPSPTFIVSMLSLLSRLPITDVHLRESGMGKIVNQLHKKSSVAAVIAAAKSTLDPWKAAFGRSKAADASTAAPAAAAPPRAPARVTKEEPSKESTVRPVAARTTKLLSINPLTPLATEGGGPARAHVGARLATNPLAIKQTGVKRLGSLGGPRPSLSPVASADSAAVETGAAARAAAASAKHEEEWKGFEPPVKKQRTSKRVTWAPGANKDAVKVQIRHYINEVKNPHLPDGPNLQDAEWGFVDVNDEEAVAGGATEAGGEKAGSADQHHEVFRNAVRQEHAIESRHHAQLSKSQTIAPPTDPSVDATLWHNCKPACNWDVDWFPPEMTRPTIGQGEESQEVGVQEAREKRNTATPPNPRNTPAEPFPADKGTFLPPRAKIPIASAAAPAPAPAPAAAAAAPAAAAPAAVAEPSPAPITAAPDAVSSAMPLLAPDAPASNPVSMAAMPATMSAPMTVMAPTQGAPQQIIIQPGQTLFPGGAPGGPIIVLSHDNMQSLPFQLGGSTLQLPAHLPQQGGPVILQYQDSQQGARLEPNVMHQHQQRANERTPNEWSGYSDGNRHSQYSGNDREWTRGGDDYHEHSRYGDDGGDQDDYGRGGDHDRHDDGDWEHEGAWNEEGHGFRGGRGGGRHGGRSEKSDRGRGSGTRGRGRGPRNVPCMYFNTPKGCKKGDSCPFDHSRGGRDRHGDEGGRGRGDRGRGRSNRGGRGARGGGSKPYQPD